MELLAPVAMTFLSFAAFFAVGAGFAWIAWYVDRAWRGRGLALLSLVSATAGACLLAVWTYSQPESRPAVAGLAPLAIGFPLLLSGFGAAAVYVALHRRDGARPPNRVVFEAGAVHFWAGAGFAIVLIVVREALARFWT